MPQLNIQSNTTRLVLFSLVQDQEIIINVDKTKHFQHSQPEVIDYGFGWVFVLLGMVELIWPGVNISHFPKNISFGKGFPLLEDLGNVCDLIWEKFLMIL